MDLEKTPDSGQAVEFKIELPLELEAGVYSNLVSFWASPHDFTLDFCVTLQKEASTDETVVIPARVVSRIKVPLTLADDILRALAAQVSNFEDTAGRIRKPGEEV